MGSKGSSTTSFTPPPEVVAAYKEALGYGRAAMNQQYQPYTGEIVAPLTPTQEAGISNINAGVGSAIPYFNQATQYVTGATDQPIMPTITPQISQSTDLLGQLSGQRILPQISPEISQASSLASTVGGANITPQQFSQEALQPYMSPYIESVANATFRNLREQQQQEQAGLQGQAIRAGAFGGDRAGIAAANLARQQDLATAMAMSNIYNQGYGQATGLFGQQQGINLAAQQANAARQLAASQQLGQIGAGQQAINLSAQQADAARQMAIAQQLYGIGAGQQAIDLSAQQANAARELQAAQMLAGMGTGLQSSILQGGQAQLAAGAQQQATQQAINQAYYNQFLGAQAYPYQQAQFFANLATGVGGQMGGTTTGTPAQPSPVGSIFGALGALGSIMSDKRTKENIKPIGKTNDGQTIYRFNYKGDDVTQIGLLAQEVEKKHPEAVTTINGMKGVDYKEATDDSVRSMGGGVVPSSVRKDFAAGGPSISDEEDPMIPYKAGVPAKVLQIPKLARIGGNKPNFGGELPKQPGGGPSEKDFKGAAAGLGAIYDKFSTPSAAESGAKIVAGHEDFMNMLSNLSFALGGATSARRRRRFADGDEVPVTEDTKPVNTAPEPGLSPKSDLPPAFQKGEISGQADAEGTPVGGVVPRPDIPLPPESSDRPRDLSFPLLRREEGYVPKAFWDVNAPRVGYSTDTKTSPEGVVTRVQRGDTMTREEAERDLTRRVVEGQNWIKSQIGEENWDRLTPEAKAAMTSIRYQYGQYPKSVLVAAASGDEALLAKAIEAAPSPTPDRMKRQANLTRGQDQGLGAYEPEGARYLKGGLGPIAGGGEGGGAGGSRKAPEASMAATDAATGDRKWNLGMAGEGKRSIIESIMDRDFDPIQKRALFSFFAGMAASPSPWFGQQLGAGMQAASNVYNESMNKQAELDIRKQQLGMEQQRIGISKEQVDVAKQNAARQLLASMTDTIRKYRMSGVPLPDYIQQLFKQAGVPVPATAGVAGAAAGAAGPAAGGAPGAGLVPTPKAPEITTEPELTPKPEGGATPIPAPTPVQPQRRAEAEPEATVQQASVQKIFAPEGTSEQEKRNVWALMPDSKNPEYWEAQKKIDPEGFDYYETRRKSAEEALQKDQGFRDKSGNFIRLPAYEQKLEQERAEAMKTKEQEKYLEENMKLRENLAVQEKRSLDGEVTALRIKELLEGFRGGALADSLNQSKALLMDIGNAIGVKVDDNTISSWIADPAKYDEFIKLATKLSFGFINEADVGKRMTNLEMTTSARAQPSPSIQPEASANMVAEILALNQYNKEARRAMVAEMQRVGLNKFNESKFIADYNDKYGAKHFKEIFKNIRKEMGVRGATPDDRSKLVPGQVYILEPGMYNNRTGKPAKARFVGNEKLPNNQIKTTFEPME